MALSIADLYRSAQSRIQAIVDELVASGNDRGLQVVVYHEGERIVDVSAGVMDAGSGRRVDGETLFPVFSSGKGVAATIVHRLVERGLLDYDAPIARYWPEFAARGKEGITLRHALTHSAGMYRLPGERLETVCDWNEICRLIADQRPLHAPGKQFRYHAITYGWLVGEPACRVTGKTFTELARQEITEPLGVSDELFYGIGESEHGRVATLETPAPWVKPEVEDPGIPNFVQPLEAMMNDPMAQRACIPGAGMIATAGALARHYAALLPGGVDGVEFLTPARRELATRLNIADPAIPIEQLPQLFGLGYLLEGPRDNLSSLFGHGGHGGSSGYADLQRGLAVGLAKNTMNSPKSAAGLVREALDSIFAVR